MDFKKTFEIAQGFFPFFSWVYILDKTNNLLHLILLLCFLIVGLADIEVIKIFTKKINMEDMKKQYKNKGPKETLKNVCKNFVYPIVMKNKKSIRDFSFFYFIILFVYVITFIELIYLWEFQLAKFLIIIGAYFVLKRLIKLIINSKIALKEKWFN